MFVIPTFFLALSLKCDDALVVKSFRRQHPPRHPQLMPVQQSTPCYIPLLLLAAVQLQAESMLGNPLPLAPRDDTKPELQVKPEKWNLLNVSTPRSFVPPL